jgi:hypothetical protein
MNKSLNKSINKSIIASQRTKITQDLPRVSFIPMNIRKVTKVDQNEI